MNPQDVQLTDNAIKELTINLNGSTVENPNEIITHAKQNILSNVTRTITSYAKKDEKFHIKNNNGWTKEVKPFEIEDIKVDVNENHWIDISIIKLLEDNSRFLLISIPYTTSNSQLIPIQASFFELKDVNFKELFKLQGSAPNYIQTKTVKYLQDLVKDNPILNKLDRKERDIFKGIF
jgi:hypothetical protein